MIRTAAPLSAALAVWLAMLLWGGLNSEIDTSIHARFHGAENAALVRIASVFSALGGWIVLTTVAVAVAVWLIFLRRLRAATLLVAVFGGRMLVELQKAMLGRVRPDDDLHLITVNSFSFPSGHAANAMITYLAIALLLPQHRAGKALAIAIAFTLALLVGLSRIVLGVHWPSDVVAGWAFGLFWVGLVLRLASVRDDTREAVREKLRNSRLRLRRRRAPPDAPPGESSPPEG